MLQRQADAVSTWEDESRFLSTCFNRIAALTSLLHPQTHTPGRIQKVDSPQGSVIYTIGVLESRIGGSTFWILPKVWESKLLAVAGPGACRAQTKCFILGVFGFPPLDYPSLSSPSIKLIQGQLGPIEEEPWGVAGEPMIGRTRAPSAARENYSKLAAFHLEDLGPSELHVGSLRRGACI